MRKLDTFVADFPYTYRLTGHDRVSKTYSFPKSHVSTASRDCLLILTLPARALPAFYKVIKGCDIKIGDISYVLAAHYHPDHIG